MAEEDISSEELDKAKNEAHERKKKHDREYMKDFRENYREDYNEYQRNYMAKWRKEHPDWRKNIKSKPKQELTSQPENNREELDRTKYMKEYRHRPGVEDRLRKYSREYIRDKREYDKILQPAMSFKEWRKINKISPRNSEVDDLVNHIKEVKTYPSDFPVDVFNRRLDDLLKDNPRGVEEKVLQDIVYDILEREKPSTVERMVMIYKDSNWENAIDCLMNAREYFGEIIAGDKIYMHKMGEEKK